MKKKEQYNLYFFYKARKRLRELIILDGFPFQLKDKLLNIYTFNNYKKIEFLFSTFKLLLFSLLYFIFFYSSEFTKDAVNALAFSIFVFVFMFMILISLSLNEKVTENVEKDHYFRMLGITRNNLQKEVIMKRINYAYFNWLIPLTFFPFIYLAFQSSITFLIGYLIVVLISYYINTIVIFITQKIIFVELRKLVIIDVIIYGVIVFCNFLLIALISFLPIFLFGNALTGNVITNVMYGGLTLVTLVLEVLILEFLKRKMISNSFRYSITSAMILSKDNRKKVSSFSNPNWFLRLISSKNNKIENYIVIKDIVSFYRKDKKRLFSFLFVGLNSLVYSGFIIASLLEKEFSLKGVMFADFAFTTGIVWMFIMLFYKLKNDTWYSCEGLNTRLYSKFNINKHVFYKAKKKVNQIILSPLMLFYAIPPLFVIFLIPEVGIGYVIGRVLYLYLLFTVIIDYSLYMDVKFPRKYRYETVSGLGGLNLGILLFFMNLGLIMLIENISKIESIIGKLQISYEYLIPLIAVTIFLVLKLIYIIKSNKLKTEYEEEKIYG